MRLRGGYRSSRPDAAGEAPGKQGVSAESLNTLRRLLPYVWPYRGSVVFGFICLIAQIGAELFPPLVWKFVVDSYLETGIEWQLGVALIILAVSYALASALGAVRTFVLTKAASAFIYDLRRAIFARLQQQPISYFQDRRTGDLMSRAVNDVEVVQDVLVTGPDVVLASGLRVIGVAFILVYLQPVLGLASIMPMVGVGFALHYFNIHIKDTYRAVRGELGAVSAKLQDKLAGMPVIKAFAREDYEEGEFADAARLYYDASVRSVAIRTRFFPAVRFIANMGQVIMLGLGAWLITQGSFTIGGLVAYRGYGRYFYGPIDRLMGVNDMIQRASAGAERILEVLDHQPAVEDAPDAVEMPPLQGSVEFHNVSFDYPNGRPVLKDISFRVQPGEIVGLFGRSGIGKTTLMNLIPRFYDVGAGAVLVDGQDVREVTQVSLRRQIGMVPQETFLFNGTVKDNIRYGRLDATDAEVEEAARLANAHEFILELVDGYDTEIGERGARLSGGQRQRIAIARCFLSDPRIILMDEPTSAVEPDSERTIIEALRSLAQGRTTFIVSHRLTLLSYADRIISLNGEGIESMGTHAELLKHGGSYAEAWQLAEV